MSPFRLSTFSQRSELIEPAQRLIETLRPRFLRNCSTDNPLWRSLIIDFADFQLALCDEEGTIVAVGNTIPLAWNGGLERTPPAGWEAALAQGFQDQIAEHVPTTLVALSASISASHQGQGLGSLLIRSMHSLAGNHGLAALIVPVRPLMKSRYPLTSIERYAQWKQADGSPFDFWMRFHWKLGARLLGIAPKSITMTGTVMQWEEWTEMRFPESGKYIVPEALEPVIIDCECNLGTYVEPSIWMWYDLEMTEIRQEASGHRG